MANVKLTFSTAVDLQGLQQLEKKLQEIRTMSFSDLSATEINKTIQAANTLERALKSAYNADLNTMSVDKFNQHLKASNTNIQELRTNLAKAGPVGQQSFLILANQLTNFTKQVKYTNKFLSDMQQTFKNTITWGISSGIWNTMLSETQKAYHYVVDLDKSLNDIRIVTGKSADEMTRFAKEANKAAKELAVSTKEYTQGALIYYQQGLDNETVKTLTDITAKTSNVTGQSMETVSEQLTAVWNGYQVANQAAKEGMQVYEQYVDKMAAVGATTASDLEELATAMSKVASAASSMGVGFDELSAQIATIVSVTRQAPESVGTALKTIYARLGDLQVDGVDEFGVSLGTVSGQLKTMGVDVMDANGNMRDMDEVMTEVAGKWNTWTDAQKEAAAVAMAGKRQYNNLIALFDNWDMYGDSLKTSMEAAGTLNEQQETALESLDKKLEKMTVAAEKFYDALFDEKSIGSIVDGLTGIIDLVANLTDGIGGLMPILTMVGASMIKSFGKDLGKEFVGFKASVGDSKKREESAKQQLYAELKTSQDKVDASENPLVKENIDNVLKMQEKSWLLEKKMTQEEKEQYDLIKKERFEIAKKQIALEDEVKTYKHKGDLGKELAESLGKEKQEQEEINKKIEERQTLLRQMVNEDFGDKNPITEYRNKKEATAAYEKYAKDKVDSKDVLKQYGISGTEEDIEKGIQEKISKKDALQGKQKKSKKDKQELAQLKKEIEIITQAQNKLNFATNESTALVEEFARDYTNALKKASKSGKENEEFFKRYQATLEKNIQKTGNFEEAVHQTALELAKENEELAEASRKLNDYAQETERAKQKQKEFEDVLDTEATFSSVADAVGSCIQVVTGFGMALNSLQAASDPAKSLLENLVAGYGGLVSGIALAVQGIFSFKQAWGIFAGAAPGLAAKIAGAVQGMATSITTAIVNIPVIGWILGIIAAIGALIAVVAPLYNAYKQEKLNEAAAEADKAAEASKKITQQAKKEKEAIDAVADAYKDLSEQYEKQEITLDELRTKTYDLCNQYGLEDLALKTLMGDYESLNELMKEQQMAKNNELIESGQKELGNLKSAVKAGIYKNIDDSAQETVNGQQYIDVVDGAGDSGKTKDVLAKYIKANQFSGGFVSNEALTEAAMKNYDEIYNELSNLTEDSAKHLLSAMESIKDKVDRGVEVKGDISGAQKENLVSKYNKDIQDFSAYSEAIDKMVAESVEVVFDNDEKAAKIWAQGALGSAIDDTYQRLATIYQLASQIAQSTGQDIDMLGKKLEKYSDHEIYSISLNFETATAYEDLDEFVKEFDTQVKALGSYNASISIKSILEMDGKTQLTDAEIESLYNLEGFEEKAGDMAAFAEMSFGEQREIMKQYYAEQQAILHSNLDTAIAEMEQYYNEIEAYAANHNLSQMLSDQVEGLTADKVAKLRQMIVESTNFGHDWTETIKPQLEAWGVENAQNLFSGLSATWTNVVNGTIDASAEGRYKEAGDTLATLRRAKTTDYSIKDIFKENKKAWDEEFDLYAKWENELEKISKSLEKLDKVQSHLHGKELIKSLEDENKLLKEQSQLNEGLLTAKTKRAGELKTTLVSKFAGKVQFDENGAITNYEEVSKEMLNWYNNRQDEDSEAIYEDFKKYLEEYSNLYYQEIPELQNKLLDDMYETISNNLEAWEVEIELQLDTKEAEREMLDFVHDTSDNFKKEFSDIGAELNHILSISGTYTQPGGTIAADAQAINDVIAEINKIEQMGESYYTSDEAMFGSMSEAQAKLEQLQSTLLKDAKEVHQAWQDGWDAYMEGIDQASEKYEKFNEQYERINEGLEYQSQLIELLYGPEAYALQGSLLTQQLNTSKSQIEFTKEQVDLWQSMYDQAEEGSEEQLKYAELLQESQSKLNDLTLAHIQLIKDEYANTVSSIIKNLENEMTNNLGFDKMREEWERALEESEKYYDSVEKIYQIDSLQNKYQNAINNTSSTKYQQAISDMMADQLSMLEEKEKMTEYDVQLAEKRLSILEAEAALEDAQNAKNAMKLVRGADGNWGYQYVADTKDVEQKQQNLQDAYNDLYTFTKKAQQDAMTSLMDAKEQYLEDLQEIYMQEGVATEEKEAQAQALYERYYGAGGTITLLNQEYEQKRKDAAYSTMATLTGYYKTDEDAYRQMDANERELVDKFTTDTGATYAQLYADIKQAYEDDHTELETKLSENWSTWEQTANNMSAKWNSDDENSIKTQVKTALGDLKSATEDYEKKVDEVANLVGQDFNSEEGLTGDIGAAEQKVKDLEKATEDLDDNVKTDLENFKGYVEKLEDAWEAVNTDLGLVISNIDSALLKIGKLPDSKTIKITYEESTIKVGNGGSTETFDTGKGGNGDEQEHINNPGNTQNKKDASLFKEGDQIASAEQRRDGGVNQVRSWWWDKSGEFKTNMFYWEFGGDLDGKTIKEVKKSGGMYYYRIPLTYTPNEWFREEQLVPFDTGGYTGEWDSSGKMAMLHQKEIVLNAKDTENLLATVDTVRDMANVSSSIGSAIMQNVRAMTAEALGIRAGTVYGNGGSNNETSNIFNITAEFPNANSVAEIQEAILSLPNLASQYLAERRR